MHTIPPITRQTLFERLRPQHLPQSRLAQRWPFLFEPPPPLPVLKLRQPPRLHPLPAPEHGAETTSLPNLRAIRGRWRVPSPRFNARADSISSLRIQAARPGSFNSSAEIPQTLTPLPTSPEPTPSGSTGEGASKGTGPASAAAGLAGKAGLIAMVINRLWGYAFGLFVGWVIWGYA